MIKHIGSYGFGGCRMSGLYANTERLRTGLESPLRSAVLNQEDSCSVKRMQETELFLAGDRLACLPAH